MAPNFSLHLISPDARNADDADANNNAAGGFNAPVAAPMDVEAPVWGSGSSGDGAFQPPAVTAAAAAKCLTITVPGAWCMCTLGKGRKG